MPTSPFSIQPADYARARRSQTRQPLVPVARRDPYAEEMERLEAESKAAAALQKQQAKQAEEQAEAERKAAEAQAKEQLRAENNAKEQAWRREKRPMYTDADGRLQSQFTDAEWKAQQGQQAKNDALRTQYFKEQRPWVQDAQGNIVPRHSDEEWQALKNEKAAKLEAAKVDKANEALRKERKLEITGAQRTLAGAEDAATLRAQELELQHSEAASKVASRKRFIDDTQKQIENDPGLAPERLQKMQDAIAAAQTDLEQWQAKADALDAQVRSQKAGVVAFKKAAQPVQAAWQAAEDAVPSLTVASPAMGVNSPPKPGGVAPKTDAPQTPGLRDAVLSAFQASVASDPTLDTQQRQQAVKDIAERRDPAAYAASKRKRLAEADPDTLEQALTAEAKTIEARTADFNERMQALNASTAGSGQALQAVLTRNKARMAQPHRAADLVTVDGPEGQPISLMADMVPDYQTALGDLQTKQTALQAEADTLDVERDEIELDAQLHAEGVKALNAKREAEHAQRMAQAKLERTKVYDQFNSLPGGRNLGDKLRLIDETVEKHRGGDDAGLMKWADAEMQKVQQEATATQQRVSEAVQRAYAPLAKTLAQAEVDRPLGREASQAIEQAAYADAIDALAKELGDTGPVKAGTMGQPQQSPARQQAVKLLRDARATDWAHGDTETPVRYLSDGQPIINPSLWMDREGFQKAVDASEGTPEQKAKLMKDFPRLEAETAKTQRQQLDTLGVWNDWVDQQPAGQSDAELIRQFDDKHFGILSSGAWKVRLHQALLGVAQGVLGIGQSLAGTATAVTRAEAPMKAFEALSKDAANIGAGSQVLPTGQWVNMGTSMLVSTIPSLAGGTLKGASALAGMQTFGQMYGNAVEGYEKQGLSRQEALNKAWMPAAASGLTTALLTKAGGEKGVEALLRSGAWKADLKEWLKAVGGGALQEGFLEEAPDQLVQGMLERHTFNPEKSWQQIAEETLEAGIGGALMGGMFEAMNTRFQAPGQTAPEAQVPPADSPVPAVAPIPAAQSSTTARESALSNPDMGNAPAVEPATPQDRYTVARGALAAWDGGSMPADRAQATKDKAAVLVKIAEGAAPADLEQEELMAVGLRREDDGRITSGYLTNKGDWKKGVRPDGFTSVELMDGQFVVTDRQIERLRKVGLDAVADTFTKSAAERRKEIQEQVSGSKSQVSSEAPAAVETPVETVETPPVVPFTAEWERFNAQLKTLAKETTPALPAENKVIPPITGTVSPAQDAIPMEWAPPAANAAPEPVITPEFKQRASEIAVELVKSGIPKDQALAVAGKAVEATGIDPDGYAAQIMGDDFRAAMKAQGWTPNPANPTRWERADLNRARTGAEMQQQAAAMTKAEVVKKPTAPNTMPAKPDTRELSSRQDWRQAREKALQAEMRKLQGKPKEQARAEFTAITKADKVLVDLVDNQYGRLFDGIEIGTVPAGLGAKAIERDAAGRATKVVLVLDPANFFAHGGLSEPEIRAALDEELMHRVDQMVSSEAEAIALARAIHAARPGVFDRAWKTYFRVAIENGDMPATPPKQLSDAEAFTLYFEATRMLHQGTLTTETIQDTDTLRKIFRYIKAWLNHVRREVRKLPKDLLGEWMARIEAAEKLLKKIEKRAIALDKARLDDVEPPESAVRGQKPRAKSDPELDDELGSAADAYAEAQRKAQQAKNNPTRNADRLMNRVPGPRPGMTNIVSRLLSTGGITRPSAEWLKRKASEGQDRRKAGDWDWLDTSALGWWEKRLFPTGQGSQIDRALQELHEEGYFPEASTPGDVTGEMLRDQIAQAIDAYQRLRQGLPVTTQEAYDAYMSEQEREAREAGAADDIEARYKEELAELDRIAADENNERVAPGSLVRRMGEMRASGQYAGEFIDHLDLRYTLGAPVKRGGGEPLLFGDDFDLLSGDRVNRGLFEQAAGTPAAASAFTLEAVSAEQLDEEMQKAARKAKIAAKQAAPLQGSAGEYGTPDMLDITAGPMALFSQPVAQKNQLFAAPKRLLESTRAEPPPARPDLDDYLPSKTGKGKGSIKQAFDAYRADLTRWEAQFNVWAEKQGRLGVFTAQPVKSAQGPMYQRANVVTPMMGNAGWRMTVFGRYEPDGVTPMAGDWADGAWVPIGHDEFKTKPEAYEAALSGMRGAEFTTRALFAAAKRVQETGTLFGDDEMNFLGDRGTYGLFEQKKPATMTQPAPKEPLKAGGDFSLESVTGDQLDAEAEKRKTREEIQKRQDKPLIGTVGDIGQMDMLGGGDLFATPPVRATVPDAPATSGSVESDRPRNDAGKPSRQGGVQPATGSPRSDAGDVGTERDAGEDALVGGDSAAGGAAPADGARGPDRVQGQASRVPDSDSRGEQPGGSSPVNDARAAVESGAELDLPPTPPKRPKRDEVAAEREQSPRERQLEQAKIERDSSPWDEFKVADPASIARSVPMLLPQQQEDVLKAERRFFVQQPTAEDPRKGVLFTNGTGTGKTFTGLGIIKRFEMMGKNRVLIVVPNQQKMADWKSEGERVMVRVRPLKDTQDVGEDVVVTTYANMRENWKLQAEPWDLVVYDESHYLGSNAQGEQTANITAHELVTGKPGWRQMKKWIMAEIGPPPPWDDKQATARYENEAEQAWKRIQYRADTAPDTKAVFLSATPFAYHKSLTYADGFLFNSPEHTGKTSYNTPQGFDRYLVENFGYTMRTNRLNQPPAEVDVGLMEREWAERQFQNGAMSGRMIDVPFDYSREFVLLNSETGRLLDDGFKSLSGWEKDSRERWPELVRAFNAYWHSSTSGYVKMMQFMESIKVADAIERMQQHLDLGRKIVLFHSYNNADPVHPFQLGYLSPPAMSDPAQQIAAATALQEQARDWMAQHPAWVQLNFKRLQNPRALVSQEFGDKVRFFNGEVSKKDRAAAIKAFQEDDSGVDIFMVQSDAGKEGISLHDLTGKRQRVLMNASLPVKPTDAIQQEGRIYRIGVQTNAIQEYLVLHTNMERSAFGSKISQRTGTVENMALGKMARTLTESFKSGYLNAHSEDASAEQGLGGKKQDAAELLGSDMDRAISYYFSRMKKTSRNKAAEGQDYFATPEPVGLVMVRMLEAKAGMDLLEPSAGHGAIGRFFPDFANNKFIEPSRVLADELRIKVSSGKVETMPFEDLHAVNKFDGVAMNPPFGTAGKLAMEHVAKAAKHLRQGGRLVAIIPEGPAMQKRFDAWLEGEGADMHLRASYGLPTVTFERAGTSVKTRIVVLDKADLWTIRREDSGVFAAYDSFNERRTSYKGSEKAVRELLAYMPDFIGLRGEASIQNRSPREIEADTIKELFDQLEDLQPPSRITKQTDTQEISAPAAPTPAPPPAVMPATPPQDLAKLLLSGRDAVLPVAPPAPAPATPAAAAPVNPLTAANPYGAAQTLHAKRGTMTYVAQLKRRISDTEFNAERSRAKQFGGYWSSYKAQGAIPGFQFESTEKRDAFLAGYRAVGQTLGAAPKRTSEPPREVEPGFYSRLEQVIGEKMAGRASAKDIWGLVSNPQSGIKAEELKWSGLELWLAEQAARQGDKNLIAKADVLDYLRTQGAVRFEEVRLSDDKGFAIQPNESESDYAGHAIVDVIDPRNGFTRFSGTPSEARNWIDEENGALGKTPKFAQYTLPGGENYREVVVAMRINAEKSNGWQDYRDELHQRGFSPYEADEVRRWGVGAPAASVDQMAVAKVKETMGERWMNRYRDVLQSKERVAVKQVQYTSSHFPDVPNYLAHYRANDRVDAEGQPGTLLEELQSDRHQAGREKGYVEDGPTMTAEDLNGTANRLFRKDYAALPPDEKTMVDNYLKEYGPPSFVSKPRGVIPDAPYRSTWPLMLFKRALREAVETGKQWIGWTTGDTQFDRWGSERFDWKLRNEATERRAKTWIMSGQEQVGGNAGGVNIEQTARDRGQLLEEKGTLVSSYEDVLALVRRNLREGKAETIAEKLWKRMQTEPEGTSLPRREGMQAFYDSAGEFGGLVKEVNRYVKAWGAGVVKSSVAADGGMIQYRVKQVGLFWYAERNNSGSGWETMSMPYDTEQEARQAIEGPRTPIWRVDITPAMRESVKGGQMLFAAPKRQTGRMPDSEQAMLEHRLSTAKAEIEQDIASGQVPGTVRSWQDLQEHVDANEYVNDLEREDRMLGVWGRAHGWKQADYIAFTDKLIAAVDAWLKGGRADALREDFKLDNGVIQAYFDLPDVQVPVSKQPAATTAIQAALAPRGDKLRKAGGETGARERQERAARGYRGLIARSPEAVRQGLDEGKGRIGLLLHEFIRHEIPHFDIRGAVIKHPADFAAFNLAVRSPFFESVKLAVLGDGQQVIHSQILHVGALNESTLSPRMVAAVIDEARRANPKQKVSGVILGHNHPSGDPSPSDADNRITRRLAETLEMLGVPFNDHIITNGERYFSFRESGLMLNGAGWSKRKPKLPALPTPDRPSLGTRAEFEAMPRSLLLNADNPTIVKQHLDTLRTADPGQVHAVFLDTRLKIIAVHRIDQQGDVVRQILEAGAREGAKNVLLSFPNVTGAASEISDARRRMVRRVREMGAVSDIILADALQANTAGEQYSWKEYGLLEDSAEYGTPVDEAAHEAATSPQNDLDEPTEAQKDAGNYKKGHVRIAGHDISIENPAGSKRNPAWPVLQDHYGYFKGTNAKDGDHVDVFVKPGTPEDYAGPVHVVRQVKVPKDWKSKAKADSSKSQVSSSKPGQPETRNLKPETSPRGEFDEYKVMLGYPTAEEARAAYLRNYEPGWPGLHKLSTHSMEEFGKIKAQVFTVPADRVPGVRETDKVLGTAVKRPAGLQGMERIAPEKRAFVAPAIWEMYVKAYGALGMQYTSAADLSASPEVWEVARNAAGEPEAFFAWKPTEHGFKLSFTGQNGTQEGKATWKARMAEYLRQPGYYAELSDAPEHIVRKAGLPALPVAQALRILGKPATPQADGEHYERFISGLPTAHVKAMFGQPWTPQPSTPPPSAKSTSSSGPLSVPTSPPPSARTSGMPSTASLLTPSTKTGSLPEGSPAITHTFADGYVLTGSGLHTLGAAPKRGITAYHGTPHQVNKFRTDKIGTGEGAQVYGWGLYFAQDRSVAEHYREALTGKNGQSQFVDGTPVPTWVVKAVQNRGADVVRQDFQQRKTAAEKAFQEQGPQYWLEEAKIQSATEVLNAIDRLERGESTNPGNLYTVELLPDESEFLDWDKPLSEQPEIRKKLNQQMALDFHVSESGQGIYSRLSRHFANPQKASERLAELGISGIRYLDSGSRLTLQKTSHAWEVYNGAGKLVAKEATESDAQKAMDRLQTRNFVIFDENLVRILEENGKPVASDKVLGSAVKRSASAITPEQDAAYLAAVQRGDMETAQRIVDEAAKAAGYNVGPVWHGHTGDRFTSFSKDKLGQNTKARTASLGFFFSETEHVSQQFEGFGENARKPLKIYLTLKNPIVFKTSFVRRNGEIPTDRYGRPEIIKDAFEAFWEMVEKMLGKAKHEISSGELQALRMSWEKLGYDAIIFNGTGMDSGAQPDNQFVVFSPEQIKSADTVTYDDAGNVIPLSQRFNAESDSILFAPQKRPNPGAAPQGVTPAASPQDFARPDNALLRGMAVADWNRLDKAVKDQLARVIDPVMQKVKQGVTDAGELAVEFVTEQSLQGLEAAAGAEVAEKEKKQARERLKAQVRRAAAKVVRQVVPDAVVPADILAKRIEMNAAIALSQEKALDISKRALEGKTKLVDIMAGVKAEEFKSPDVRRKMYQAMNGKINSGVTMDDLTPEQRAVAEALKRAWWENGMRRVRNGTLRLDTFQDMAEGMPQYYEDDVNLEKGFIPRVMRMGLKGLIAQRSTRYHITDKTSKDKTGEDALVTWTDPQTKKADWKFKSKAHMDAALEDIIEGQILAAKDARAATSVKDLSADDVKNLRSFNWMTDTDRAALAGVTRDKLRQPNSLTPEQKAVVERMTEQLRRRFQKHVPLTFQQHEKRGLIMDPFYAISRALLESGHDNATAEFFNYIAKQADYIRDVQEAGFTAMPNDPRMGRLAGKWVRDDVAAELEQLMDTPNMVMRLYDWMLSLFKYGHTILNVGSHVRNVVGNIGFAQMAGSSPLNPGNWKAYGEAMKLLRDGGTAFESLHKLGILGGDYLTAEVRRALRQLMPDPDTVSRMIEAGDMSWLTGLKEQIARKLDKGGALLSTIPHGLEAAWKWEDDIYKVAAFVKARQMGQTEEEAAAHVRKWFPFYDKGTSGTLKALGRFVFPFLSFKRESLRIMGHALKERPLTFLTMMALPRALTQLSFTILEMQLIAGLAGLGDDDKEDLLKDMKGRAGGLLAPFMDAPLFSIALPYRDASGGMAQWDLSAVIPWSDWLSTRIEYGRELPWFQRVASQIVSGAPFASLLVETWANQDTFSGRRIWEDDMSSAEKLGNLASHTYMKLTPPMAGPHIASMMRAMEQQPSKLLPQRNPTQALMRILGIDIKPLAPDLYRKAEEYRKAQGAPVSPRGGQAFPKDAAARARARLYLELIQPQIDVEAANKEFDTLASLGEPVRTVKDLADLFKDRNAETIMPEKMRAGFVRSLPPESRRIYDAARAQQAGAFGRSQDVLRQRAQMRREAGGIK